MTDDESKGAEGSEGAGGEPGAEASAAGGGKSANPLLAPPREGATPWEDAPAREISLPAGMFTKGGTPTERSERLYQQRYQEGEERRRQDDADKALVNKPIEQGGGAQLITNQLTDNPEIPQAYVLLHYVNRAGSKIPPGECLADVFMEDWENPGDLTLGLMCPKCWEGGVKRAQDCQIRIRMSNRRWYLDTGKGGEEFAFDDGYGPKVYLLAGIITESEVFTCPDCSWRARIVNNYVRTEG